MRVIPARAGVGVILACGPDMRVIQACAGVGVMLAGIPDMDQGNDAERNVASGQAELINISLTPVVLHRYRPKYLP